MDDLALQLEELDDNKVNLISAKVENNFVFVHLGNVETIK